jgi:hypothetical protein
VRRSLFRVHALTRTHVTTTMQSRPLTQTSSTSVDHVRASSSGVQHHPTPRIDINLAPEASISEDQRFVHFAACLPRRTVLCAISREALELYFGVPKGADEKRLQAYVDGRTRIAVAVERGLRRKEREPIVLRAERFSKSLPRFRELSLRLFMRQA